MSRAVLKRHSESVVYQNSAFAQQKNLLLSLSPPIKPALLVRIGTIEQLNIPKNQKAMPMRKPHFEAVCIKYSPRQTSLFYFCIFSKALCIRKVSGHKKCNNFYWLLQQHSLRFLIVIFSPFLLLLKRAKYTLSLHFYVSSKSDIQQRCP